MPRCPFTLPSVCPSNPLGSDVKDKMNDSTALDIHSTSIILLIGQQPGSSATALYKFCPIHNLNRVCIEFWIDPKKPPARASNTQADSFSCYGVYSGLDVHFQSKLLFASFAGKMSHLQHLYYRFLIFLSAYSFR